MEDYRAVYMRFVETIAAFATRTIEQHGVLSTAALSREIEKIIADQPEISIALWARGFMVRDGVDVFAGTPMEDVEAAYTLAQAHDSAANTALTIAGVRATCERFRQLQTFSGTFGSAPAANTG